MVEFRITVVVLCTVTVAVVLGHRGVTVTVVLAAMVSACDIRSERTFTYRLSQW